ncbi:MAG: hypothetical protein Kow0020_00050 [Wenzhouxiangellaceae bacterium]
MSEYSSGYCRQLIAWFAAGLLLIGCDQAPKPTGLPGESDYRQVCAGCHGADGAGRPPTFPPLAGGSLESLRPEAAVLIVLNGLRGEIEVDGQTYRGYMPPLPQIDDARLARILAYLRARFAPGWDEAAVSVERIAELRRQNGAPRILVGRAGIDQRLRELNIRSPEGPADDDAP